MNYQQHVTADRRLQILRLLAQDPGGQTNHIILHQLLEEVGHRPSVDQIKDDLAWMEELQLVEVSVVGQGTYHTAQITERGSDVANGRSTARGVRKPRPSELG